MKAFVLRTRWLLSALLLTSAALFVLGVGAERNVDHHHEDAGAATHIESGDAAAHDESGEELEEPVGNNAAATEEGEQERAFGLDLESVPLVLACVAVSIALPAKPRVTD